MLVYYCYRQKRDNLMRLAGKTKYKDADGLRQGYQ
jgi:hypothetical protein